jgi:hypothetical protein
LVASAGIRQCLNGRHFATRVGHRRSGRCPTVIIVIVIIVIARRRWGLCRLHGSQRAAGGLTRTRTRIAGARILSRRVATDADEPLAALIADTLTGMSLTAASRLCRHIVVVEHCCRRDGSSAHQEAAQKRSPARAGGQFSREIIELSTVHDGNPPMK